MTARIDYLDPSIIAIIEAYEKATADRFLIHPDRLVAAIELGLEPHKVPDLPAYEIIVDAASAQKLDAAITKRTKTLEYVDEGAERIFNDAAFSFGNLGPDVAPPIFRMRIAIVERLAAMITEYANDARVRR
jgi:hypothetical protein